jgi:alpha-L-fucosidase
MKDTKQQWFKESKYGLFIHWGLYSLLAGEYKGQKTDHIAEWIMNNLEIPVMEYEKLALLFNPSNWNADALVKQAKEWGMKYIVFTSKHHDGFSMYHSKISSYNIVDATPFKRDVVKELSDACKKYNLRFGLYYSQAQDWHDPDGYKHMHDNTKKNFQAYFERKCIPQVKELLTNYGDISLLWFDTPMGMSKKQSQELVDTVKDIQPDCVVSGRVGNNMGDYMTTGDNFIPSQSYLGDWEVPATLNDTWGFNKFDTNWKSPDEVLNLLVKINSRGGNYLLNIGPDGTGRIPKESCSILDTVATYVNTNSDGIFKTKAVVGNPYEIDYGLITRTDYRIFVHVLYKGKYRLELQNIANRIKKVYVLNSHESLEYSDIKACEGNSMTEIELPEKYRFKTHFCVCIETEERDIVFEPLNE